MLGLFSAPRALTVTSPAMPMVGGQPALVPLKLEGTESVNSLYCYTLTLQTPDELGFRGTGSNFSLDGFIGLEITCSIELEGHGSFVQGMVGGMGATNQGAGVREISGLITAARFVREDNRHAIYQLEIRPWLYLATLTSDCKVFQDKTPVEVIEAVLADYNFASDKRLVGTYTLCTIPDALAALREMHRVLTPAGKLLFCEHGRAPDASVQRWQDRLQPVWGPLAGGCHLGRDIPALLTEAGFTLINPQTRYLPGPRPFTFHYWGEALPRSPDAVSLS